MKRITNFFNTLRQKNITGKFALISAGVFGVLSFSSCVNEWPKPEELAYDVTLIVHCDTDWLPEYDMTYNRADNNLDIVYLFQIYKHGQTENPVQEFSIYSSDFSREDFSVGVTLMPGSYDVYVWSDICNATTGKALFYDTSDFSSITYLLPYEANSNNKDAFRGMTTFTIKDSMEQHPATSETIIMKRPLSRYIFVATDLNEFIDNEISRGKLRSENGDTQNWDVNSRDIQEELERYKIKVIYPLYMPAVFDVFTNKPYDSWTGISFDGAISPLSETTAALGLDYVMINTDPSSVQVALEIYDADGERIGGTSTLNVPILRDRTTIIYGEFLTSDEDAGVVINPDFEGQYNIEYR